MRPALAVLILVAASRPSFAADIDWVRIPGGTFVMGSNAYAAARPQRRVKVRAFEMARTPVTFRQYRACAAAGACAPYDEGCARPSLTGDDQPAVCVDWNQAKAFSKWAGGRLPSEAEWEYVASGAGKDWKYPWGDEEPTCERAVIAEGGDGCGRNATWPVCSKPKGNTAQGLCDVVGNVWEWTQDWYRASYNAPPTQRVYRGSSWYIPCLIAPARMRYGYPPEGRYPDVGFRPVRDIAVSAREKIGP